MGDRTATSSSAARVGDPRLAGLVEPGVPVECLGGGATWSEGPLWLPGEDAVIWSDIPHNRVLRWTAATGAVTVDRTDVEFTNGRCLDLTGRVVTCSHGRRAIERTNADGPTEVLVDRYGVARLNSPNDVVVASDGAIWFTDPPYGILQPGEGHPGELEYGRCYVFRFEPDTGDLRPVVTDMEHPNGLAFSPDESRLYVADTSAALRPDGTGNHHIRVYDLDGTRCTNGRVFAEVSPGLPDGLRVDVAGNVWTSSGDSVQVYAPDGTWLGKIGVPETVANLCFGGPDRDTLYIAATTSLYRLPTRTRGASPLDLVNGAVR